MTLATAVLVINELMAANVGEVMSPATNFDSWIEIYNPGDKDVNLGGMYLSNDAENLTKWKMPSAIGSVPAKGFKVVWLGSNDIKTTQATFKLDCDGGTIILSDGTNEICSAVYPPALSHTAWALKEDGGSEWGWTATPTPEASNATATFADERLDAPVVSRGSCLFDGTVDVTVDIPAGARLMYTTDGSLPTAPTQKDDDEEPVSGWEQMLTNGDCEGDDASCYVSYDGDVKRDETRIVDGVGVDGSRGVKVHAIENPEEVWDTQFFVYAHDYTLKAGDKYRFSMKVRADKPAYVSVQSHAKPHDYIHWKMLEGGYNITTQWTEIVFEGAITEEQAGEEGMQTIAFNLNEAAEENNFYFDEFSWELYYEEEPSPWVEFVKNGNCEGDDATCLVSRDAGGTGDEKRIVDGVGYEGSRGIRIHSLATAQNDHDAQLFVYTPDHIWRSGEKYRFSMKVRADKDARITCQTHTTPHNYIYWSILDGSYNVTTEWQEITYEGTITDEQVGKQGGGWWWGGEETFQDMQTIAFNLNVDRKDNYYYFDDVSWELFTDDGQAATTTTTCKESKDGKFSFSKTTSLTVRLFQDGYLPSVPVTRSYIKTSNKYTLPVISIVGDKKYFTDPKSGIDCDGDGTNGKTGNGQEWPKNYNQPWDRPVNFSYLTPEGEMMFNQDVNISVSGGWTRSQHFRSFKLKSNKVFDGQNHFDFQFFPQKPYNRDKALLVRNGGNDVWTHNARFLDPALETIIQRSGIDIDVQSYVPIIEYVNGELRGVLNLRETNNDKFAYANWGYDDDELDAFENFEMKNGDDKVFKRILELGENINDEGAYDELKTLLDIDEFTNYMAVTIFLHNDDWPNNNIKGYRSRNDGRYRFVSFDLDYAFAGCNGSASGEDPFTYIAKFKYMDFVKFFFNLLEHDTYRRKFIDTFCLVAGSVFEPTKAAEIIDELLDNVRPMTDLMKQQRIDGGHYPDRAAATINEKLNGRSEKMTGYMKQFEQMKLGSATRQNVTLNTEITDDYDDSLSGLSPSAAIVKVNGIVVPTFPTTPTAPSTPTTTTKAQIFKGHLFAPVELEAMAPAGYVFAGWKKGTEIISMEPVISLPSGSSVTLTATFTAAASVSDELASGESSSFLPPVRINEVSAANGIFVNEYFKRNDWVELYNTTSEDIDVAGMYISDNPDKPYKYQIQAPSFNPQLSILNPEFSSLPSPLSTATVPERLRVGDGTSGMASASGSSTPQLSTIIPAHGYLIIWCDKLEPETQLHASFKLAAEGDDLLLTAEDGSWSDLFTYEAMKADETAGRYPDGTDNVYTMNIPTIAKANRSSSYLKPFGLQLVGDVNRDGVVDVADISAVISVMAGSEDTSATADVNGDGTVDVADISSIISIMAGK